VPPVRPPAGEDVDRLHAELLRVGESRAGVQEVVTRLAPGEGAVVAVLRRAVPQRLLEYLATTDPWSSRSLVLAAIVSNPRAERSLCLRLVPQLPWRALLTISTTPWASGIVRTRAEAVLKERLAEMRLGEKIALARAATPALLFPLIQEPEPRIVEAVLQNPRLREEDLLYAIGRERVARSLLEVVADARRWREAPAVRLALVLQPSTPLPLALAQISGLMTRDLRRVSATTALRPLLRAAAQRVLEERGGAPAANRE
jgi:hypothetical protein